MDISDKAMVSNTKGKVKFIELSRSCARLLAENDGYNLATLELGGGILTTTNMSG